MILKYFGCASNVWFTHFWVAEGKNPLKERQRYRRHSPLCPRTLWIRSLTAVKMFLQMIKKMWSKSVKDLTFCNQMRNVPCYCQNVQSALSLFITELPNCIKGDVAFEDCLLPLIMNKMFLRCASKCSFDDRKQKEIWEKSTNHQQNVAERLGVIRKSINGETTRRLGCRCYF